MQEHPMAVSRTQLPPSPPRPCGHDSDTAVEEIHPHVYTCSHADLGVKAGTSGAALVQGDTGSPAEVWWQQPKLQHPSGTEHPCGIEAHWVLLAAGNVFPFIGRV